MDCITLQDLSPLFPQLLAAKDIFKAGAGIAGDAAKLFEDYKDVVMRGAIDVAALAAAYQLQDQLPHQQQKQKQRRGGKGGGPSSLSTLCEQFLGEVRK